MALATTIPLSAIELSRRMAIRSEPNPYDKATIFNIYPRNIKDTQKVTLTPNKFLIPAGNYENPGRLVVGPAVWWRDVDPEQPLLEIPVPAIQLAESIVRDTAVARLGSTPGEEHIGLFFLPGEITVETLKKEYKLLLDRANVRQRAWFTTLVKQGDSLWARSNGNPLAIDDTMRLAAKELGLQRDWTSNFRHIELIACIACGQLRNPAYPVCNHCKVVVDREKAEKLGLIQLPKA